MSRQDFVDGPSNKGITERFDTSIYEPKIHKVIVNDNLVSTCLIIQPHANREIILNIAAQKADLGHIGYGKGFGVCPDCFGSRSHKNHVNGLPDQWIEVVPSLHLYYKWQFLFKERKQEIKDHKYDKLYQEQLEREKNWQAQLYNAAYIDDAYSPEEWAKLILQYRKSKSRIYQEIAEDFAKNKIDVFTQYRCNFCDKEWIMMK